MTCTDFDILIAARAAGDLAPDEAARLDSHLPVCPRCQGELAACREVLDVARLARADSWSASLAPATLALWKLHHRPRHRRAGVFALGGALAVAAAAMLLAVAPGVHLFQTAHPTAAPVLAGEDSDADRASWAASDPGVYGSEADEGSYTADVVLAALDDLGEDDLGEDDAL